ncbi:MAG: protein arginine kinase [Candidatus Rhabdochlamydia sp.]
MIKLMIYLGKKTLMEKFSLPNTLLSHTPWENQTNAIWPATCFSLSRNLASYHFPAKMLDEEFERVYNVLYNSLCSYLPKPLALKNTQLSALDKEFLFEHFLCLENLANTHSHQGFVLDETGLFFGQINKEDHLHICCIDYQGEWEKIWNRLNQIETDLSKTLDFSFSHKFGFLTSYPQYSGTALRVHAYLHLPAIIHCGQLQEILAKSQQENIYAIGMSGTLEELIGDLIILSNVYTLGINEETILDSLHKTIMNFMALEKTLRTHLKEKGNPEIKDQVGRAYGLLLHSYQLQEKEALNALSIIKLGLELNWVKGVSEKTINDLLFTCRRAHLAYICNTVLLDPQESARKRAEFLHKQLQGIALNI